MGKGNRQNLQNTLFILASALIICLLVIAFNKLLPPHYLFVILIDLGLVLSGIKYLNFFKHEDILISDVNYPPDQFDPAQAGFILDGYVDDQDLIALIIYLCCHGYIKIIEENGDIFLEKGSKMHRVSTSAYQRDLVGELFNGSSRINISDLNQRFFISSGRIRKEIEQYFNLPDNRIYSMESLAMQQVVSAFLAIPFILCFIVTYSEQMAPLNIYDFTAAVLVSCSIGMSLTIPVRILINLLYHWNSMTARKRLAKISLILLFSVAIVGFFVFYTFVQVPILAICSLFSFIVLACFAFFMRKRTPQGQEWFSRLISLKKYIEEASIETILRLVDEDPHYYFKILPYTYIMGVSDKWSARFDLSNIYPFCCPWFDSQNVEFITHTEFNKRLLRVLDSLQLAMTSRPPIKTGSSGHP